MVAGLLLGVAAACQGPARPAAKPNLDPDAGLPAALVQLLPSIANTDSSVRRADLIRLLAERRRWAGDSLGRLLVYSRLATSFRQFNQPQRAYQHQCLAWRMAGPRQRRQYPAYVMTLAMSMANYLYIEGKYDSARTLFRQAVATFQTAGLDSTQVPPDHIVLRTTDYWDGGKTFANCLGSTGLTSRRLGNLPEALRYYERASVLYQRHHNLSGTYWTQELVGEAQAEQGNDAQAAAAYEQALGTTRAIAQVEPGAGSMAIIDVVLNYYVPLLLPQPGQRAYACRLAAEGADSLLHASPNKAAMSLHEQLLVTQLQLVPAEAALRDGQPAAAERWLTEADQRLRQLAAAHPGADKKDLEYPVVQALTWGLRAWQQHGTDPARAQRLLDQAIVLLQGTPAYQPAARWRQQLATYCLAMGEPGRAARLLCPLTRLFGQQHGLLPLSQVTELLSQAYAGAGRYDSAYRYARRARALADTVRATQQFAALAATEARFHTREQASQIHLLTEQRRRQALRASVAAGGALLLGLALLATALAWRAARHLNRQLATQSRQLQDQAIRLGELDRAKNQFFANVSHELRTPLTLILGPLEGLLNARPLPPAVQQPLALAYHHAQRLRELVNRILDLTKLQAGRMTLHPVPTQLTPLLRRLVGQFESLAEQRQVTLHGPAALPGHLRLLLDADKVEQVLTNLLINALNHTPPGGTVAVEAQLPGPDGQYAVTVRDTGPGIAEVEQARVFERYYQSPQGPTQGGTGLGLALSRELATLLGGSLTLASEPGHGAAFTLRFPAAEVGVKSEELRVKSWEVRAEEVEEVEEVEAAPKPAAAQLLTLNSQLLTPTTRPRVLVVEDQPDLREYLRQLLAATHDVLTAADGQAALDLLAREAPVDLITTDAMMPRLSGLDLLGHLRADPALASVPVLMLTARADEAHRLTALTVGVDDYLTKPFVTSELLARVRALLARQQVRRHFATQLPEAGLPTTAPPPAAPPGEPAASPAPPIPATPALLAQWQTQVTGQLADPRFGPAELAALLCLSERTLYRRLGELVGLTPAAWLRELRLNQARLLLEAGSFGTVEAVARATGFGNAKHFATLYAERFGRRPASYAG